MGGRVVQTYFIEANEGLTQPLQTWLAAADYCLRSAGRCSDWSRPKVDFTLKGVSRICRVAAATEALSADYFV